MAKQNITYQQAVTEIEEILEKIENHETDVDELTENVKRVSFLLKICKDKLYNTEKEVQKIIDEMGNEQEES